MSEWTTVALDAMGGDFGPSVTVPAALRSLEQNPKLKLVLVGDEAAIESELSEAAYKEMMTQGRLSIKHASEKVEMADSPSKALRNKKDSSMRVAINMVQENTADACVSAGNTGALMATARFVLKTIPGIDRPAISTALPSIHGLVHVLDLGANVESSADHLYQFAVMGNELVKAVDDKESPKIGLLNIGEEEIKGNEQVKQASKLLSDSHLNYIGYVEGNDIFWRKDLDVVVTDGFVGNIALKASEGMSKMISQTLKESFKKNPLTMLMGLIASPVLKTVSKRFDPSLYNGASLLGLRGIVIKSHGSADIASYANAIRIAQMEVKKAVPQKITERVESAFAERKTA